MSRLLSGVAGTFLKAGVALGAGAIVFNNCFYTVEPGYRAVIFDRTKGITDQCTKPGLHAIVPVIQWPIIMDVRTQPRSISTVTGTKDLQRVNLSLRVLFHPNAEKLPEVFQKLGQDFAERVLPSISNEVLKAVVARYNADQLLTMRDQVSREIRERMTQRCKSFNLVLDDVSITHLNFSKDFSTAIENKQVAEQIAERAKFEVAKAEQEKLALIIRSEGDAEAAKLVSTALQKHGKGLLELRRIESAQKVAGNMARNTGVTYLPGSQGMLLNMNADGPAAAVRR